MLKTPHQAEYRVERPRCWLVSSSWHDICSYSQRLCSTMIPKPQEQEQKKKDRYPTFIDPEERPTMSEKTVVIGIECKDYYVYRKKVSTGLRLFFFDSLSPCFLPVGIGHLKGNTKLAFSHTPYGCSPLTCKMRREKS